LNAGAVAMKIYLNNPITGLNVYDDSVLKEILKLSRKLNFKVSFHAEDKRIIERFLRKRSVTLTDIVNAHVFEAEVEAVKRLVKLTEISNANIHLCHVSVPKTVEIARKAKLRGLNVSVEVTPHHVLLSHEDFLALGSLAYMIPPLRPKYISKTLLKYLSYGFIDVIASDHAPHTLQEKNSSDILEVPPGIPGLETTLSLMLNLVSKGILSWKRLVSCLAENPARLFGLKGGRLDIGFPANMTVVDFKAKYEIDSANFFSKAKYSPFDGWKVKGKAVMTIVNGLVVFDDGEIVAEPGVGKVIGRHFQN